MNRTSTSAAIGFILGAVLSVAVAWALWPTAAPVPQSLDVELPSADKVQPTLVPMPKAPSREQLDLLATNVRKQVEALREEVELREKALEQMSRNGRTHSLIGKLFAEAENAYIALNRKVSAAEAELSVLEERINAGTARKDDERLEKMKFALAVARKERDGARLERDEYKKLLGDNVDDTRLQSMRADLESRRATLRKLEVRLTELRLEVGTGAKATNVDLFADEKLDAILKELAELRKEVQELQRKQK